MLSRRVLLRLGVLAAASVLCAAHTPYRQWVAYRRKHLLILSDRTDPPSYPLSVAVAATLDTHLPASKARASRARDLDRLASLITTGQLEVALMRHADAAALTAGEPPMAGYRPVALRILAVLGEHLLICRDDFPDQHAYLVAEAIEENRGEIEEQMAGLADGPAIPESLPVHAGALAYRQGLPLPEPPGDGEGEPAGSDEPE